MLCINLKLVAIKKKKQKKINLIVCNGRWAIRCLRRCVEPLWKLNREERRSPSKHPDADISYSLTPQLERLVTLKIPQWSYQRFPIRPTTTIGYHSGKLNRTNHWFHCSTNKETKTKKQRNKNTHKTIQTNKNPTHKKTNKPGKDNTMPMVPLLNKQKPNHQKTNLNKQTKKQKHTNKKQTNLAKTTHRSHCSPRTVSVFPVNPLCVCFLKLCTVCKTTHFMFSKKKTLCEKLHTVCKVTHFV